MCLHCLYRVCGREALVPRSLELPLSYPTDCHGGFADVWKGRHDGREVAVKVLRVYSSGDPGRIRKVGSMALSTYDVN